jgi:hypothetical protein
VLSSACRRTCGVRRRRSIAFYYQILNSQEMPFIPLNLHSQFYGDGARPLSAAMADGSSKGLRGNSNGRA